MKLSIAMIVKNEERNLERTLEQLAKLKKLIEIELIIVDTGSEDNTIEIAKRYTENVYLHKWNDNFAHMRNLSLEYCTGEWIMVLDADEFILDIEELANILLSKEINKYNSILVKFIEYNKSLRYSMENGIESLLLRIFKNNGLKYEGIVHEQPKYKLPVLSANIRIIHYGYNNFDYKLMEYKFKRNLKLLFEQLNNESLSETDYIYTNYQIATSYYMHRDTSEAIKYIKIAYDRCKSDIRKYIYVLHKYCHILNRIGEYDELVRKAEEGVKYEREFIDFYFFLGNGYMKLNNYQKASDNYKKYLYYYNKLIKNEISIPTTVAAYTKGSKDTVLFSVSYCYFKLKDYKKSYEHLQMIEDDKLWENNIIFIFNLIINSENYIELQKVDKYINKYNYTLILTYIFNELPKEKIDICFKNLHNGILFNMIDIIKKDKENIPLGNEEINRIKEVIEEYEQIYAIYAYFLLIYDSNEMEYMLKFGLEKVEEIMIELCKRYYNVNEILLNVINSDNIDLNIKHICLKGLLLGGNLSDINQKRDIFLEFISTKYCCIIKKYNKSIIEEKLWILNQEEQFILEIKRALQHKYLDILKYIRELKKIAEKYGIYPEYIKLLADEEIKPNNLEIQKIIPELIFNIENLIKNEEYLKSYLVVDEALALVEYDFGLLKLKYNLAKILNKEKEEESCFEKMVLYGPDDDVNKLINNI
ncbi:glycosyltransferase involved in cell wall biosynthesis [Clostridium beijerinckii]|uniref:glycosyltransferase family 2 protein n=1 Tax=Clostridium beijerinckii TaxID=1520 RepID=UPI001494CC30|nr:glycosyltransferase family 2 protein [Clostridium beijerinckii]NOW89439.1 glycosyltransferase involved in cell wall biosynthesis [Clostridium beijerinckii]